MRINGYAWQKPPGIEKFLGILPVRKTISLLGKTKTDISLHRSDFIYLFFSSPEER